jgi:hypothetical protein
MQRFRQLALTSIIAIVGVASFAKEGFTSGGGEITIEHDLVKIHFATSRKEPMPGDEAAYNKQVVAWEKANRPVAENVLAAVEAVLPKFSKKVSLVAKSFARSDLSQLSAEGTLRSGYTDETGPYLLTIDLDVYPGEYIGTEVQFVVAKRPAKADLRNFAHAVQAAAVAARGRKLPAALSYTAYWLEAKGAEPAMLLSSVPLAKLTETLQATEYRMMGYETFRNSPALLLTTHNKQFITRNSAEFLVANPTGAKFDAAANTVTLQVNGNYMEPMTARKAKRTEALNLLAHPVDTTLKPAAQTEARKALADDIDFLDSLKPALAK